MHLSQWCNWPPQRQRHQRCYQQRHNSSSVFLIWEVPADSDVPIVGPFLLLLPEEEKAVSMASLALRPVVDPDPRPPADARSLKPVALPPPEVSAMPLPDAVNPPSKTCSSTIILLLIMARLAPSEPKPLVGPDADDCSGLKPPANELYWARQQSYRWKLRHQS
jgi:hypothetical protein